MTIAITVLNALGALGIMLTFLTAVDRFFLLSPIATTACVWVILIVSVVSFVLWSSK